MSTFSQCALERIIKFVFIRKYHYLKHKDIYKAEQDTNGALCEIVDQNFKLSQFYNSNLLIYTKLQELT